jgi:hypothetical protein
MTLDLNKLENKLDEALSNETTETLNKFLNDKRMTNNKQQTVVEWIEQEMLKPNLSMKEILEQAKEMEKERMIGFTNKYINSELWVNCNAIESDSTVEQYYEQTYEEVSNDKN